MESLTELFRKKMSEIDGIKYEKPYNKQDKKEFIDEKAGIYEYDVGMSREKATKKAEDDWENI